MTENRTTFINRLIPHFSQDDIDLVMFAYDLSKEAHRTQKRHQGGRYFDHPRMLCIILMDEFQVFDRDLLITLLLHDVGEDTPMFGNITEGYAEFIRTATFRITRIFNAHVADTVIKLTKPHVDDDSKDFTSKSTMMDHYLTEMVKNEDATVGKALDRLHNLRTIPKHKHGWAEKQAAETRNLLIPCFLKIHGARKELITRIVDKIEEEITVTETSPA